MWAYASEYNYCNVAISGMILPIFILHYVTAVWSFISFLFDSSTLLQWCQKQIQFRLDCWSEEHFYHNETQRKKWKAESEKDILSLV